MPYLSITDFERVHEYVRNLEDGNPELPEALLLLDKAADSVASPGLRELANDLHGSDDIEIDDEGVGTSESDDGVFVQAWVWVPHDKLVKHGLRDPEPDEEDDDA